MAIKSTITLRLDDEQQAAVAGLQAFTGQRAASKAILTAVRRYPDELRRAHDLEDRLRKTQGALNIALDDVTRLQAGVNAVQITLAELNQNSQASEQAEMDGFEQGHG